MSSTSSRPSPDRPVSLTSLNRSPPRRREDDEDEVELDSGSRDRPNKLPRVGGGDEGQSHLLSSGSSFGISGSQNGHEQLAENDVDVRMETPSADMLIVDQEMDAFIAQMINDDYEQVEFDVQEEEQVMVRIPTPSSVQIIPEPEPVLDHVVQVQSPKDTEMQKEVKAASDVDPNIQALEDELSCGMCSALFIDPVVLDGCGHAFCGSCVTLWLKALPPYPTSLHPGDPIPTPISCPHCRHSPIRSATPSRVIKTLVNVFILSRPEAKRTENEKKQAEAIYPSPTHVGGVIKFPQPPAPPKVAQREFWRPCKSCYPDGEGVWRCPIPVPRAEIPAERELCLPVDGMCPEGHRLCAGCNRLSPSESPTSANCSICGEGFCGNAAAHSCSCLLISDCEPASYWTPLSEAFDTCPTDLLSLAFRDNFSEINWLQVYLSDNDDINPQSLFKEIVTWLGSDESVEKGGVLGLMTRSGIPFSLRNGMGEEMQRGFMSLRDQSDSPPIQETIAVARSEAIGEVDMTTNSITEEFGEATLDANREEITDIASSGTLRTSAAVPQPEIPAKMCGGCVDEIFSAGLYEWWMREVVKPEVRDKLPANMKSRANCKHGYKCERQARNDHSAKCKSNFHGKASRQADFNGWPCADNHLCEPLPQDQADHITQNDAPASSSPSSSPQRRRRQAISNGPPGGRLVQRSFREGNGEESEGEGEDESDGSDSDPGRPYVDVGVQWEEGTIQGKELFVSSSTARTGPAIVEDIIGGEMGDDRLPEPQGVSGSSGEVMIEGQTGGLVSDIPTEADRSMALVDPAAAVVVGGAAGSEAVQSIRLGSDPISTATDGVSIPPVLGLPVTSTTFKHADETVPQDASSGTALRSQSSARPSEFHPLGQGSPPTIHPQLNTANEPASVDDVEPQFTHESRTERMPSLTTSNSSSSTRSESSTRATLSDPYGDGDGDGEGDQTIVQDPLGKQTTLSPYADFGFEENEYSDARRF